MHGRIVYVFYLFRADAWEDFLTCEDPGSADQEPVAEFRHEGAAPDDSHRRR